MNIIDLLAFPGANDTSRLREMREESKRKMRHALMIERLTYAKWARDSKRLDES